MKTSELIALLKKELKKSGDLDVFLNSGNDDAMYSPFDVGFHETEKGEFPRSWNMPRNFIKIMG